MKTKIIFLMQFSICFTSAFAQSWMNYNTASGMHSNSALVLTSDKFNNIWVGVGSGSIGDGLDKFDGTAWTHYDNTNSGLPENDIRALKADTNGNLWMSFYGGAGPNLTGLTKFDGTNWTIYDTTNSAIISNHILDIQIDNKNNLWLSCMGGISKFDGTTFTNYLHPYWGFLVVEDSANIWQGAFGLDHFNPITGVWTHYDQGNSNIPSNYVSCIGQDTNGIIWLGFWLGFNGGIGTGGTNGGLATFDGTTFTTIWPLQNPYTGVYGLTVDASNNVWVSTRCEGLYKYDGVSWSNISGVPLSGCSFCVASDHQNYIWYAEVYSGVWTNNPTVGIIEQPIKDVFNLFPNPTNNIITITLPKNANIKVLNMLGEIDIEKNFGFNENGKVELDISFLSSGIYFIKSGNKVGKFVKE